MKLLLIRESDKCFLSGSFELPVPDKMKSVDENSVILGFRPNEMELVSRGGMAGSVSVVETMGSEKLVYLNVGENTLSILVPSSEKVNPGGTIRFRLKPDALHLFNISTQRRISFE